MANGPRLGQAKVSPIDRVLRVGIPTQKNPCFSHDENCKQNIKTNMLLLLRLHHAIFTTCHPSVIILANHQNPQREALQNRLSSPPPRDYHHHATTTTMRLPPPRKSESSTGEALENRLPLPPPHNCQVYCLIDAAKED